MPEMHIAVREKRACQTDRTVYVCGSGDYTAVFDFDEEWLGTDLKTARFQTENTYQDVLFRGNSCPVPMISYARKLEIGVFAGNLRTTTCARVALREGIRSAWGPPEEPGPNLCDQILEALEDTGLDMERTAEGVTLTVRFRGGEKKAHLRMREVYVGGGDMPEGYWVQVDPTGARPVLRVRGADGNLIPIPSIQGPKGDKGEKGEKGDPGPQGPRGDLGEDVVRGVNGVSPDAAGTVTLTAADIGALPGSGGTMTGAIDMGGSGLENLKAPVRDNDAATKAYTDGKRKVFTAVLGTGWSGAGPYTQTAAVSGILESDMPHVAPAYDEDGKTAAAQRDAWGCVGMASAVDGGIRFTCFEAMPGAAVPLQIEVMR